MNLILKRIEIRETHIIGLLCKDPGQEILCFTLERPWVDNRRNVSCIPGNEFYSLVKYKSQRYGWTLRVEDVPDRTGILFHAGNTVADTKGCILPGKQVGKLNGARAVLHSASALSMLRQMEPNGAHTLYIVDDEHA